MRTSSRTTSGRSESSSDKACAPSSAIRTSKPSPRSRPAREVRAVYSSSAIRIRFLDMTAKLDHKCRSRPTVAIIQSATHVLNQLPRKRKPEADAARLGRVEGLEHAVLLLLRKPRPCIRHRDFNYSGALLQTHGNASALVNGFERIQQQIQKSLIQLGSVARCLSVWAQVLGRKGYCFGFGLRLDQSQASFDQRCKRQDFKLWRIAFVEDKEMFQESLQTIDFVDDEP